MNDTYLNYFYHLVHLAIIVFSTLGWLLPHLHRLHLAVLLSILGSWVIGGAFYGLGYCFLTDWHWQVRRNLGIADNPHSYTQWLFQTITGLDINPIFVDTLTILGLIIGISGFIWKRRLSGIGIAT